MGGGKINIYSCIKIRNIWRRLGDDIEKIIFSWFSVCLFGTK